MLLWIAGNGTMESTAIWNSKVLTDLQRIQNMDKLWLVFVRAKQLCMIFEHSIQELLQAMYKMRHHFSRLQLT